MDESVSSPVKNVMEREGKWREAIFGFDWMRVGKTFFVLFMFLIPAFITTFFTFSSTSHAKEYSYLSDTASSNDPINSEVKRLLKGGKKAIDGWVQKRMEGSNDPIDNRKESTIAIKVFLRKEDNNGALVDAIDFLIKRKEGKDVYLVSIYAADTTNATDATAKSKYSEVIESLKRLLAKNRKGDVYLGGDVYLDLFVRQLVFCFVGNWTFLVEYWIVKNFDKKYLIYLTARFAKKGQKAQKD